MTINDVITYVMNTPYNSNPAVLRGMLADLSSSSSGEDIDITTVIEAFNTELADLGDDGAALARFEEWLASYSEDEQPTLGELCYGVYFAHAASHIKTVVDAVANVGFLSGADLETYTEATSGFTDIWMATEQAVHTLLGIKQVDYSEWGPETE